MVVCACPSNTRRWIIVCLMLAHHLSATFLLGGVVKSDWGIYIITDHYSAYNHDNSTHLFHNNFNRPATVAHSVRLWFVTRSRPESWPGYIFSIYIAPNCSTNCSTVFKGMECAVLLVVLLRLLEMRRKAIFTHTFHIIITWCQSDTHMPIPKVPKGQKGIQSGIRE